MTGGIVRAPFDPDQVDSLNAAMESELIHPLTCGNDCPLSDENMPMAAETNGLYCIEGVCGRRYRQDWAPGWLADWSWQETSGQARARHRKEKRTARRTVRDPKPDAPRPSPEEIRKGQRPRIPAPPSRPDPGPPVPPQPEGRSVRSANS